MGNFLHSKANKTQRRVQPKWSKIEHRGDTPPVLSSHTAVFSGDSIVIFGGYSNGKRLNDVYEFYCSTAMWKKIESVDPPSPRVGMSSTLDGDTMIIFGIYSL
jgi:N-acetylneuraminic acid mutarotase